jgi:hypothetical protein
MGALPTQVDAHHPPDRTDCPWPDSFLAQPTASGESEPQRSRRDFAEHYLCENQNLSYAGGLDGIGAWPVRREAVQRNFLP